MKNIKQFRFGFWPLVITLTAFAILCKLGFWQLERAEEKQAWLEAFQSYRLLDGAKLGTELKTAEAKALNGRTVEILGEVRAQFLWLVDNKTLNGRPGYKVLAPVFVPDMQSAVIVDFGWIAAPKSRQSLPSIELPAQLKLRGVIKSEQLQAFVLNADELTTAWPQRIQSPASALQATYPFALESLLVYADSKTVDELPQTYKPVVMLPEKHRAYDVQWFLLAFACIGVFFFASYQRSNMTESKSLEVSK